MASDARSELPRPWAESLAGKLRDLERQTLTRSIVTPETGPEPQVTLGGKRYVHFTSNNYLGLSTDPRIVEASVEATRRYGASTSASRLLCGSTPLHDALEAKLARLKRTEACLLFSSGYLANVGLISALAGPDDAVFSDRLNHASIIDGCRLSRATTVIYPHCDVKALEGLLQRTTAKRRLIVSESVFSMDGDIAPVRELVEVAKRFDALLVLDEAHATGVLGPDGGGALSHFGIAGTPTMIMGTLSKALGSAGGFVAANATVVDFLRNRCRTFIFNTALPAGSAGAALTALDIVEQEPWRREKVLALSKHLREGFVALGYPPSRSETPIVPLVLGEADVAVAMEQRLKAAGVLARAIRPPTVPPGTSRIRFNVMASHDETDVGQALAAVRDASRG